MTILSAQSLRLRGGDLLTPFCERTVAYGMSFGLSMCGYDIRIAENMHLPPKGFALASSIERFTMSLDLVARVADKSTWARLGLAVQNTVIEPGWCGHLTLELSNNHDENTLEFKRGMPIAQVLFELLDRPTIPYAGKYQDQPAGAQPAKLEGMS